MEWDELLKAADMARDEEKYGKVAFTLDGIRSAALLGDTERQEPCDSYNGDEVDIGVGVIWSPCHNCGRDRIEHTDIFWKPLPS